MTKPIHANKNRPTTMLGHGSPDSSSSSFPATSKSMERRGLSHIDEPTVQLIQQARDLFLQTIQNGDEGGRESFYPQDIDRVITNDWYVRRFLLAGDNDVKESVSMLTEALRWRKRQGLRDLQISYFPAELFQTSWMFRYEVDNEGCPTIYFRVKNVIKHPDLVATMKKLVEYFLFVSDESVDGTGITIIADLTGCGLQQAESMDLVFHGISVTKTYFPFGISRIVAIDLPWILKASWLVAKAWVPANRRHLFHFVSRSEIRKIVDDANIPHFLGGTCTTPYGGKWALPDSSSPTLRQFAINVLSLSDSAADKLSLTFKVTIDSVEREHDSRMVATEEVHQAT